jgi:hypothetical protein
MRPGETLAGFAVLPSSARDVADSVRHVWTVEIVFTEDADLIRADAYLSVRGREFHGEGRSQRVHCGPNGEAVGQDLAASQGLVDLAQRIAVEVLHATTGMPPRVVLPRNRRESDRHGWKL